MGKILFICLFFQDHDKYAALRAFVFKFVHREQGKSVEDEQFNEPALKKMISTWSSKRRKEA
jgi:hypothetical protein